MWQITYMGKTAAIAEKLKTDEVKCDDLEKDVVDKVRAAMIAALEQYPDGSVAQISAAGHQLEVSEDGKRAVNYLSITINPIQGFVEVKT